MAVPGHKSVNAQGSRKEREEKECPSVCVRIRPTGQAGTRHKRTERNPQTHSDSVISSGWTLSWRQIQTSTRTPPHFIYIQNYDYLHDFASTSRHVSSFVISPHTTTSHSSFSYSVHNFNSHHHHWPLETVQSLNWVAAVQKLLLQHAICAPKGVRW